MKALHKIVGLVALVCMSATATEGKMREWIATDGSSVEAEIIARDGDEITLRNAAGITATLNISQLAPESRKHVPDKVKPPPEPKKPRRNPTDPVAKPIQPRTIGSVDPPTWEKVESFKKMHDAPDGARYFFYANIGPKRLSKEEKAETYKNGKIPYRITCRLTEGRHVNGKWRTVEVKGQVNVVVVNPKGETIFAKRLNLSGMSIKGGPQSGYFDTVNESGKYTMYIWIEHNGVTYGIVDSTTLWKTIKPHGMK